MSDILKPGILTLSLWQPWASLIGIKQIETRSWSTRYRGPIAIHATKRPTGAALEDLEYTCGEEPFAVELKRLGFEGPDDLPYGAIIKTARLVDCVSTGNSEVRSSRKPHKDTAEFAFGDYSDYRFMWFLEDIVTLTVPVPAKGAQGLWAWTPETGDCMDKARAKQAVKAANCPQEELF